MKIGVHQARDLPVDSKLAWSAIQGRTPECDSPYFCPEFTVAMANVRPDVEVAVLEQGSQAVGFFPFQRSSWGRGRPVGGILSDFQGAVISPAVTWTAAQLIRACRLRVWDFDHLLVSQEAFVPFHRSLAISPFIDLSAGFESYAQERQAAGTSVVRRLATLRNKVQRDVGPLRFHFHLPDLSLLHRLLAWKSCKYAKGGIDIFQFKWTVALLERILQTNTDKFAGILSVLCAGDIPIAAHMGMRSSTVWHYWFPSYDRNYAQYSPGLLLLLEMAKTAPSVGLTRIDLGRGGEPYKQRFMNGFTRLALGFVAISPLVRWSRRCWAVVVPRLRASPFRGVLRFPARMVRGLQERRLLG